GGDKYTVKDGELFQRLGRKREVERLWGHVADARVSIVAIQAVSGAGKSSLLEGGLRYLLTKGFDRLTPKTDLIPCAYCEMASSSPLARLYPALVGLLGDTVATGESREA